MHCSCSIYGSCVLRWMLHFPQCASLHATRRLNSSVFVTSWSAFFTLIIFQHLFFLRRTCQQTHDPAACATTQLPHKFALTVSICTSLHFKPKYLHIYANRSLPKNGSVCPSLFVTRNHGAPYAPLSSAFCVVAASLSFHSLVSDASTALETSSALRPSALFSTLVRMATSSRFSLFSQTAEKQFSRAASKMSREWCALMYERARLAYGILSSARLKRIFKAYAQNSVPESSS